MKVLLIQPPTPKKSISIDHLYLDEPLALEYLGADLAHIAEVRILDMRLENNLLDQISSFKPDIVGITGFTVHVSTIKAICQQVKQLQPEILTVVGGHHATVAPEDFACPSIDIVVTGDGVPTLREIVQKMKIREEPRETKGVAFLKNGEICLAESRPLTNLDDFPLPDRSLTRRYRKHYHGEWMEPVALVRTSRGCPNQCSFCAQWKLTGRRYLKRSVQSIIEELRHLEEKSIYFADDESFIDTKRMSDLAKSIKAEGIRKNYKAVIRSDTVVGNPELLEEWREIGLDSLAVGLEFYAQKDLDYVDKRTSLETNNQAIQLLEKLGIHLYPLFMVRPEYDERNFMDFATYVKTFNFDKRPQFSVLTPLPGADFYEQVKGQILEVGWEYFDCVHTVLPTKLPIKEFYRQLAKLYRESTTLKSYLNYLRRHPLTKMPRTAWVNYRDLSRINSLYKDYPG